MSIGIIDRVRSQLQSVVEIVKRATTPSPEDEFVEQLVNAKVVEFRQVEETFRRFPPASRQKILKQLRFFWEDMTVLLRRELQRVAKDQAELEALAPSQPVVSENRPLLDGVQPPSSLGVAAGSVGPGRRG